ncbi:MAG: hypothetical protein IJB85_09675 [Clostridia bacterium]|nr:hypothetical protein [Clostridia bacterium]
MTALLFLCYAILLLAPVLTLLYGLRCQKAAPGAACAYPIDCAPSTPDACQYTQKLVSSRLVLFSILMLIAGIGFMIVMPFADTVSLLCCVGIALGIEIVILLVGMTIIGMALQNHFKAPEV